MQMFFSQHHLISPLNFAIHKIKPRTLTTETVKNNFKGTIQWFVLICDLRQRKISTLEAVFIWSISYGLAFGDTHMFLVCWPKTGTTSIERSDQESKNLSYHERYNESNQKECSYPPKNRLMISGETMRCSKVKRSLQYQNPLTFLSRKIYWSCAAFILSVQRLKRIVIRFSNNASKETARARSSGCCKEKQKKVWSIWWFGYDFFAI